MAKSDETSQVKINLSLTESLFPIILLIIFLSFNVYVYGDDAMGGSNQFILLIGAAAGIGLGLFKGFIFKNMMSQVAENLKSVTGAIVILLFVGALSGTWLISGIIPSMIYYGLNILHPSIFLPACLIICAIISIATGSSWTTSATVGIALIGISKAIGIPVEMSAGAIISGAYFGDKLSPLSDTTNLAPAISGSDLFTHIKYLTDAVEGLTEAEQQQIIHVLSLLFVVWCMSAILLSTGISEDIISCPLMPRIFSGIMLKNNK